MVNRKLVICDSYFNAFYESLLLKSDQLLPVGKEDRPFKISLNVIFFDFLITLYLSLLNC